VGRTKDETECAANKSTNWVLTEIMSKRKAKELCYRSCPVRVMGLMDLMRKVNADTSSITKGSSTLYYKGKPRLIYLW
jgi:Asp-tRNA(Asn)/Glu-tRNA(Gln) amidotransferase B subunit